MAVKNVRIFQKNTRLSNVIQKVETLNQRTIVKCKQDAAIPFLSTMKTKQNSEIFPILDLRGREP